MYIRVGLYTCLVWLKTAIYLTVKYLLTSAWRHYFNDQTLILKEKKNFRII